MTTNHTNTHDHYLIELVGSDTAVCPDLEISYTAPRPKSRDPIGPLARKMIAAGCDPEKPLKVSRGSTVVFHARRLGTWAERDIYCLPTGGFATRPWRCFPGV